MPIIPMFQHLAVVCGGFASKLHQFVHLHGLRSVLDGLQREAGLLHVELLVVQLLPLVFVQTLLLQHLVRSCPCTALTACPVRKTGLPQHMSQ